MILYGKKRSLEILRQVESEVLEFKKKYKRPPCLALILASKDPASSIYVEKKINLCHQLGMDSLVKKFPLSVSQEELLKSIQDLNESKRVHGILIQLPLPSHLNERELFTALDPLKDVDGLHPYNLGSLFMGRPSVSPCTPSGIMELLKEYKIPISGKNCLVVGRSLIVGKPLSQMLLNEGGSVTICHSKTRNLEDHLLKADIICVAIGKKEFFRKKDLPPHSVVIDVGIHRTEEGLKGDVHEEVRDHVQAISPVPGGVGPMTLSSLMKNTIDLARIQMEKNES